MLCMDYNWNVLTLVPHLLAVILFFVGPLLDPLLTARLKASIRPNRRTVNFLAVMAATTALSLISLQCIPASWWLSPWTVLGWPAVALATLCVATLVGPIAKPVFKVLRRPELRKKTHVQFAKLEFMLPQSASERRVFVAVCLVAGIGEEIIFRGFLPRYFMSAPFHFPAAAAFLAASIGFALNHIYQGWKSAVSTGIVGLIFSAMAVSTGSLIPGMIIHALIDLRVLLFTLPPRAVQA